MQTMVDFMLDTSAPNSVSSLINCVTIIIDIIRHNNSDLDQETSFAVVLGYQNQIAQQSGVSLINMLSVLTENISRFVDLLIKPNRVNTPHTKTPLGFERLKICELFAELLHCSNMSSLNVIQGDADKEESSPTYGDSLKLAFVKHKALPVSIVSSFMRVCVRFLFAYRFLYRICFLNFPWTTFCITLYMTHCIKFSTGKWTGSQIDSWLCLFSMRDAWQTRL